MGKTAGAWLGVMPSGPFCAHGVAAEPFFFCFTCLLLAGMKGPTFLAHVGFWFLKCASRSLLGSVLQPLTALGWERSGLRILSLQELKAPAWPALQQEY